MRRLTTIACALAASLPSLALAHPPAQTSLHVTSCQLALNSKDRQASFYAHMHSVPGTGHMWMRFTLHERIGNDPPVAVGAPGLMGWRKSRAHSNFGYLQTVNGLEAGGVYTMTVEYRWLDAAGKILRQSSRSSGGCSELGPLAGLQMVAITAHPLQPAGTTEVYSVEVRNTATRPESGTTVAIFVDGGAGESAQVDLLAPGERRRIALRGPVCAHRVRAVVERVGSDHRASVLSGRCPAA